ncbi:cyclic nucleotide-binding domain-containing protein [Catenulispora sp. NF23]|uniref:family 2B encapsulin nanocompartment shell protein n=1 Tax=Catenulispora pinistramenti TaxID=2705254 RepID=UPI001BABB1FE|nr:family 2B encapsulin nanocompartment shell protein [Catenulispora pinistramenti]MBS2540140.1 cyclic nucleotide-binding domain-containing protein [Catenulispora pinistramenti]
MPTDPMPQDLLLDSQDSQLSLSTAAARNLATTTKTVPQMQGITSRWLLRKLPWVQVSGGTYRVNRRLSHAVGRGRVAFDQAGEEIRVLAPTLTELPVLRGLADDALLAELAARFTQRRFAAGEQLAEAGQPVTEILVVGHGKVAKVGTGKYGETTVIGSFAGGDHLGDEAVAGGVVDSVPWAYGARATTSGVLLALPLSAFQELLDRSEALRTQLASHSTRRAKATNKKGEAEISLSAGHEGEAGLPGTFVDYELDPREYQLSVAQTVLRIHSRVADLYNDPMNQTEQQLRLTVEALKERQEHELLNNAQFGLLANAANDQRIHTHSGPPTPDDMDELLSMRRSTKFFLAHPKAIAAFGRECTKRGVYPTSGNVDGNRVFAWRDVPIYPCSKIPVTGGHTTSILAMRTGEDEQGVVGLRQTGLPDELEPSLNVRFMGIDDKAIISYLVSAYYSAAILVPDALGVLENVELDRPRG